MSDEHFKAFFEKSKSDAEVRENLKAASDADAVIAIAKEANFMISLIAWSTLNQKFQMKKWRKRHVAAPVWHLFGTIAKLNH